MQADTLQSENLKSNRDVSDGTIAHIAESGQCPEGGTGKS